jgi:hypothetical protein
VTQASSGTPQPCANDADLLERRVAAEARLDEEGQRRGQTSAPELPADPFARSAALR